MPIGVVSDDDFNIELDRQDKSPVPELKRAQIIDVNRGGRKEGDNNVPEVMRKVIGEESTVNGRSSALQLAKMFDVSPSSVSAYNNGANSTSSYRKKNERLTDHLNKAKLRIASKARKALNNTLDNITEDKLQNANLKDLALVAKSMSGVIKDMSPDDTKNGNVNVNGPSIIMYNPGFTKEDSFETIDLSE